jgi:hypothetical protein
MDNLTDDELTVCLEALQQNIINFECISAAMGGHSVGSPQAGWSYDSAKSAVRKIRDELGFRLKSNKRPGTPRPR